MAEGAGREVQTIEPAARPPAERALDLSQSDTLDLSGLSEAQVASIKRQHADGMVAIQVKAAEMKLDVSALDAALVSFTEQTAKATQAGAHATIQHSQSSLIGKTEVVIGNTERARAGRLHGLLDGLQKNILWLLGATAVVVIVVSIVLGR